MASTKDTKNSEETKKHSDANCNDLSDNDDDDSSDNDNDNDKPPRRHQLSTSASVPMFEGRVATKIFEDFGGALNKAFIRGREPVSIVHYTRSGTCINRPLH